MHEFSDKKLQHNYQFLTELYSIPKTNDYEHEL